MADNSDWIMVVCERPSNGAPSGWTDFPTEDLIARRTSYMDFRKLSLVGKRAVLIKVAQKNTGGQTPFVAEYQGRDDYSFEYDSAVGGINVCKHTQSGGQAGTNRACFMSEASGGGNEEEDWDKESGQAPMQGVCFRDANPSSSTLSDARDISEDDVTLG